MSSSCQITLEQHVCMGGIGRIVYGELCLENMLPYEKKAVGMILKRRKRESCSSYEDVGFQSFYVENEEATCVDITKKIPFIIPGGTECSCNQCFEYKIEIITHRIYSPSHSCSPWVFPTTWV